MRTVAATAAKAGAKAVILPDGTISEGWIGGGCARAAVLKAAREALADGKARLVSVQPPDALQEQGVAAGEERAGVRFAKNMCPSQGTMDIFVEPVLPRAADRWSAARARWRSRSPISAGASASRSRSARPRPSRRLSPTPTGASKATRCRSRRRRARYIVVATQGRGDEAALQAALAVEADYVAFVGSRKKAEALKAKLAARGVAPERLARLKAPAGLDLGAITPDEIALSILAEIVAVRRGKELRDPILPSGNSAS